MNQIKDPLKIEMLSTGDEVLYGQIVDTNAAWLSDFLFEEGISITSRHTVGDDLLTLVDTLQERSLHNDILIVNGGLGPTSDDLSAKAAAQANNESLVLHDEWLKVLERYFLNRGRKMPSSNIKQAMLPQSATLIDNPIGTACGFKMVLNNCLLFFTPGVPSEFKEMIRTSILPDIKMIYPITERKLCYRLTTMGRTESDLGMEIETSLDIPDFITVGYRAAMPIIELKLTGPESKKSEMDSAWHKIKSIVVDNLLCEGVNQGVSGLAQVVSRLLNEMNQSIVVIEQQSAGVIGYHLLEANAPMVKSEVVPFVMEEPLNYFSQVLQNQKADIALGVVNFQEKNTEFTLVIVTKNQELHFKLKYTGRVQNNKIQQQILSAIALDGLRRYLLNLPIIGPNVWLELLV
ncbi:MULTISPECIES: CinA family nicotinamide mononucleotide deamidase-related protein [unclassified Gilliamella]|uniref:CinA family nicotinamide mononucleotide deamidase-related protein n=1 Tax=unclassified Gilliamella TaxID=2685620 RepID=UPI002269CCE7|nr:MULTISPECIES: CinA family nicotinamide mononucleotide deamidase-related protein [unclassified Gilliamella]MCX8597234.1 CinA family nicotinamide mononucleotide deamidase-related protein [Gilliamella sp. B3493]MCX8598861.1 CinA family nicotinamide mononucleotide deamidase-related protein [Gilliamella sp. B3486]MCX8689130.1 CinA family nicotinamide mononucleotide deamidase-related protein [Gilliamella sp. B2973]MCX8704833.1 CinA family nicotinamide mononucleotide deamidase-related protein [Gill